MSFTIRTLIVDDEPAARRGLRLLLERDPDIEVVGECGDGEEAARALDALAVDLVFLDVRMPEADGFAALQRSSPDPPPLVVFVTAYDVHALRAFEVEAMDYLLKPFTDERFDETLARVKERLAERDEAGFGRRVRNLAAAWTGEGGAEEPRERMAPAKPRYPGAVGPGFLVVPSTGRVALIPVDEVQWVEASGNYVRVHAGDRSDLYRAPLRAIERRLEAEGFVRIHRSSLVRLSSIATLRTDGAAECVAVLGDGTELPVSRSGRERLRAVLGGAGL